MMFFKKHFVNVFIVISLILLAWNKVLSHTFIGEGYMYFDGVGSSTIFRYDIGAALLFQLLGNIFKDNFVFYQGILLLTLIALGVLFYFFVYGLTKKKEIALVAAILFAVNFSTSLEMFGFGAYQNFAQRILFLPLLFSSFILFTRFIDTKNKCHFFVSLILASLSVALAYYSVFFIIFFPAYFLGIVFSERLKLKEFFNLFFYTFIFPFVSLVIIYIPVFLKLPSMVGEGNFLYIFKNVGEVIAHSFRQLTVLSIPDQILKTLYSMFNISYNYHLDYLYYLYVPVILLYIVVTVFVHKREKKLGILMYTSLFYLFFVFILNMFMRSENVNHLGPGSRYLFAPSIGYAIFWAIFLVTVFKNKLRGLLYVVIIFWVMMQFSSINRELDGEAYKHRETKKIIAYVKNISPKLKDDSIVILPKIMGYWGTWFTQKFHGRKNNLFIPRLSPQMVWQKEFKRPFDPDKDFIVGYDEDAEKVIDLTRKYKEIIINNDLN